MISGCPGADKFKHPQPESVNCSHCGEEVEIWTDETKAVCPKCRKTVTRGDGQSCLDWCKFAKECVGADVYEKHMKGKEKKAPQDEGDNKKCQQGG